MNTLDTQIHCITIITDTIAEISGNQAPIDVCDQPVYTLTKQSWLMQLDLFHNYFSLFSGLHVEKSLLVIHGQFTKGSGLSKVIGLSKFSIIGLDNTLETVNDIKPAPYTVQVSA